MAEMRVDAERLRRFAAMVLARHGAREPDADVTATRMLEADFRGRGGHGLFRLPAYCQRLRVGGYNLAPDVRMERDAPGGGLVDGDNGLGQVVATYAVERAIEKARASGIAWIGVRRGNHAGAAGVYASLIARENLIGVFLAVANTNQLPPWGGVEPLLGTNPVAVAIPVSGRAPMVLDIATTVVSFGTVKAAAQRGEPLPEGWMIDRGGDPLTDPRRAAEGFLLPIGGHKGYGLSLAIGLLAGVLNGAKFGREVVDIHQDDTTPTDTGQAVLALDPGLLRATEDFKLDVASALHEIRSSPSMRPGDPILVPGDQAAERERELRERGIPVPPSLAAQLGALADACGVPSPLPARAGKE